MVDRNVAERLSSNSAFALELEGVGRSEERRVGKEC